MSMDLVKVEDGDEATRLAVYGFLARYRGATLRAYGQDLQAYLRWCQAVGLAPLGAQRAHLELFLRWNERLARLGSRPAPPYACSPAPGSRHQGAIRRYPPRRAN